MLILNQKIEFFDKVIKACISSWKILSQKEAELVLAGKEIRWSHLLS